MKYFLVFLIGAAGYPLLEIIWRGHSHPSMALAGGICFLIIYILSIKLIKVNIFEKALYGAASITFIELIFGFIFNIILNMNVWDYSALPLNFHGQICLRYFLIWTFLCFALFPLCKFLDRYIFTFQ